MNEAIGNKILSFERMFGSRYSIREKYFYFLLRGLWQSNKSKDGWVTSNDGQKSQRQPGLREYGLSSRIAVAARKKLKADGLIECQYLHNLKGHRIGTKYRILEDRFIDDPKVVHAAIMGKLGKEVIHSHQEGPVNEGF